jgi:V8-like Glu-specific endopeptidase
MQFDGVTRGELREALLDAFNPFTFQAMLSERLNKGFFTYAPPYGDFSTQLFTLLDTANRENWIDQIAVKAREFNPGNPKLALFTARLGLGPAPRQELEEIIRRTNAFLDIGVWVAKLTQLEYQVCRIEVPTEQGEMMYGTGFLVGPGLVMTNFHVVDAVVRGEQGLTTPEGRSAKAAKVRCRFDYKLLDNQTVNPGTLYTLAERWVVDVSPPLPAQPDNLDCAVLRLATNAGNEPISASAGSNGEKRGFIKVPVEEYTFARDTPIIIVQHPQAEPLKIAWESNAVDALAPDRSRVTYRTNTAPGSSGSPCFTQNLDPVALHHSGDPNYPPVPVVNEGIPLSSIRKLLKQRGADAELG